MLVLVYQSKILNYYQLYTLVNFARHGKLNILYKRHKLPKKLYVRSMTTGLLLNRITRLLSINGDRHNRWYKRLDYK